MKAGIENLVIPSEEAQRKCYETANQGGGGVLRSPDKEGPDGTQRAIRWRVGELEWEAWMRVLDSAVRSLISPDYEIFHFYLAV